MKKAKYFPNRGKKTGLKKSEFICQLLAAQHKAKLSDDKIVKEMKAEYPHSHANYLQRIPNFRNLFNRGAFKCQKGKPAKPCVRYSSDGKPDPVKRGPKPGSHRSSKRGRGRSAA